MATISEDETLATLYEIRRDDVTYCQSHIENCGYSLQTIRQMQVAGFELYIDGKKAKRRGKG